MATEEKTEQATPRRRQKAREEGQVAQSKDLNSALTLGAILVALRLYGPGLNERISYAVEEQFVAMSQMTFSMETIVDQASRWSSLLGSVVLPIAGAALVTGVIVTLLQTGFLIAPKLLSPNTAKLNPANGLKRIFSLSGLVEALKGLLKVVIVAVVAYQVINDNKGDLLNYQRMELRQALGLMLTCIQTISMRYCLALLIMGIADYGYQRWNIEKQLRMTRYEVKREFRESEGDPHIRARRRQIQQSILRQGISKEMPQANVVVTNPTHVAVALMYKGADMPAPQVVARGQGAVAKRIKLLARSYGIPIVEEPPTARALYQSAGLGDYVPPVLYQAVAEVLAVVYRAAAERRRLRLAQIRAQRRRRLS